MQDGHGREIDYLRISITDKCNLRCKYCMPKDMESVPMSEILTFEETASIVNVAASLGINRIKITGGEPLVRRDCCELIRMLKSIPGIKEVTITTNGVLLDRYIDRLMEAGTDGINISIDTLDKERYSLLTGSDELNKVLDGLRAAIGLGVPVKINAVSVDWGRYFADPDDENAFYGTEKSSNTDMYADAFDLIGLARDNKVDVRFIEMMPIGMGKGFPAIPHDILIPVIKDRYKNMTRDENSHGNGPAVYYRIPGFEGSIGFISAVHGIFCDSCNRLRLTSKGYLKSCLSYDTGVDLKAVLRSGRTDKEKKAALKSGLKEAILCKPKKHSFMSSEKISEKHTMSAIGG